MRGEEEVAFTLPRHPRYLALGRRNATVLQTIAGSLLSPIRL